MLLPLLLLLLLLQLLQLLILIIILIIPISPPPLPSPPLPPPILLPILLPPPPLLPPLPLLPLPLQERQRRALLEQQALATTTITTTNTTTQTATAAATAAAAVTRDIIPEPTGINQKNIEFLFASLFILAVPGFVLFVYWTSYHVDMVCTGSTGSSYLYDIYEDYLLYTIGHVFFLCATILT